jgi:hypothetical protein
MRHHFSSLCCPREQQYQADNMILLAKQLRDDMEVVRFNAFVGLVVSQLGEYPPSPPTYSSLIRLLA